MRVGLLTGSVSRRAGGLFDSVRGLGLSLMAAKGAEVRAFGLEDGDTHRDLVAWGGVPLRAFPVWGTEAFGYAPGLASSLRMADLDLLHTHGLWRYPSVASLRWARATRRPVMVSAHGMLDAWAVQQAAWKKRTARWLYEDRHLRTAACLHAVSTSEAGAIRRLGFRNPICIIPNAVDLSEEEPRTPPAWHRAVPEGAKVLLYLGRIHPKKNLTSLLLGWARASAEGLGGWWLVVAGWDQDGHERELRELVRTQRIARVLFVGPQFGSAKRATFCRAQAFVLASHSEGLPLAVLEAWAHRLPVIMTEACNVPQGFSVGAAICVGAAADSIADGLTALSHGTEPERRAMGNAGRALVESQFAWPVITGQFLAVYHWMVGQGALPDYVVTG
jgi:glycosyltransferase involved in cell wall biosynthesis